MGRDAGAGVYWTVCGGGTMQTLAPISGRKNLESCRNRSGVRCVSRFASPPRGDGHGLHMVPPATPASQRFTMGLYQCRVR